MTVMPPTAPHASSHRCPISLSLLVFWSEFKRDSNAADLLLSFFPFSHTANRTNRTTTPSNKNRRYETPVSLPIVAIRDTDNQSTKREVRPLSPLSPTIAPSDSHQSQTRMIAPSRMLVYNNNTVTMAGPQPRDPPNGRSTPPSRPRPSDPTRPWPRDDGANRWANVCYAGNNDPKTRPPPPKPYPPPRDSGKRRPSRPAWTTRKWEPNPRDPGE